MTIELKENFYNKLMAINVKAPYLASKKPSQGERAF